MERRFGREQDNPLPLQDNINKYNIDSPENHYNQNPKKPEQILPLGTAGLLNDMVFGQVEVLAGEESFDNEDENFDSIVRSHSSRMTQEWLDEAKRLISISPARFGVDGSARNLATAPRFAAADSASPRFAGSARFANPGRFSVSKIDRRDPFSRSARRQRAGEGVGEEVLTKTVLHTLHRSETIDQIPVNSLTDELAFIQVQKWLSNVKPANIKTKTNTSSPPTSLKRASSCPKAAALPPRQSTLRKSRFQTQPPLSLIRNPIPPSNRTIKQQFTLLHSDNEVIQSGRRRSVSRKSMDGENRPLSPPRNLVEPTHRLSISRSTCSLDKIAPMPESSIGLKKEEKADGNIGLNRFLKEQKIKIQKLVKGDINCKAKVILSGTSNSTSTMVATICYARLLQNRLMKIKGEECVVIPVINIRRSTMWKQKQASWLFNHVSLDTNSLIFADEVDLESLVIVGRLSILVIGQDVLRDTGEAVSQCTILTDNYLEDAYELLQMPVLYKLLLAGILFDTQNLNLASQLTNTRDAEAVQLLLVGCDPNYRNTLFDQLMQNQKDNSLMEIMRHNNGKPPVDRVKHIDNRATEKNPNFVPTNEANKHNANKNSSNVTNEKANKDAAKSDKTNSTAHPAQLSVGHHRGKNKFWTKWFGLGSK